MALFVLLQWITDAYTLWCLAALLNSGHRTD
jgi:hypothetical protein